MLISEKEMEDQIALSPERFLGERQLALVCRQFRIGSYIFDLLFEDRHGGKLIVEIQKGTLDRNHTYKILDYYDEYREQYPGEFIDIMVVANIISAERKKRLHFHGIEYRELPEALFSPADDNFPIPASTQQKQSDERCLSRAGDDYHASDRNGPSDEHRPFQSIGASSFVAASRSAIKTAIDGSPESGRWKLGGSSSLMVKLVPATEAIECRVGAGLIVQIWMERPKGGAGACKLEIASKLSTVSVTESKTIREGFAASLRDHLVKQGIPEGIELASGSTVVKRRLLVPGIRSVRDDTPENSVRYSSEIGKIVDFLKFLDSALSDWATT